MNKILLIGIILLTVFSTSALAQDEVICTDTPPVNSECKFVTPPLTVCSSFVYSIIDSGNTTLINNSPLTIRDAALDLYEFNFNLTSEAQQLSIVLCDGSFREIIVGGGNVIPSAVTGELFFLTFIGIITLFLLFFARQMNDPVLGFTGTTGLFVIGYALLGNPFEFFNGKADFIGMNLFGLGVIILGLYFLLASTNDIFRNVKQRDDMEI